MYIYIISIHAVFHRIVHVVISAKTCYREITAKINVFTAKFNSLPWNYRENQLFYCEITAKFAISLSRGTTKFGKINRDKLKNLPTFTWLLQTCQFRSSV